jgi:hypothetical protein
MGPFEFTNVDLILNNAFFFFLKTIVDGLI